MMVVCESIRPLTCSRSSELFVREPVQGPQAGREAWRLQDHFDGDFWMEDRGVYANTVDAGKCQEDLGVKDELGAE